MEAFVTERCSVLFGCILCQFNLTPLAPYHIKGGFPHLEAADQGLWNVLYLFTSNDDKGWPSNELKCQLFAAMGSNIMRISTNVGYQ